MYEYELHSVTPNFIKISSWKMHCICICLYHDCHIILVHVAIGFIEIVPTV